MGRGMRKRGMVSGHGMAWHSMSQHGSGLAARGAQGWDTQKVELSLCPGELV